MSIRYAPAGSENDGPHIVVPAVEVFIVLKFLVNSFGSMSYSLADSRKQPGMLMRAASIAESFSCGFRLRLSAIKVLPSGRSIIMLSNLGTGWMRKSNERISLLPFFRQPFATISVPVMRL